MDRREYRLIAVLVGILALLASGLYYVSTVRTVVPSPEPPGPQPPGPQPPVSSVSFTFGFVGDLGHTGTADMLALAKRVHAANASFLLALGDLGYAADESAWCASIKGAMNDVEVLAGNHDVGENSGGNISKYVTYCPFTLDTNVTAGPGTPGYGFEYYFDYPNVDPLVRFILIVPGVRGSLNYDYGPGSPHYNWVVDAVHDARSRGIPWVVAGMHKLCIDAGTYGCDIGQALFDKLVDLKVDLILQNHYHTYQRSKQLALDASCTSVPTGSYDAHCVADDGSDGAYTKGAGSVVVIDGAGGQSLYWVALNGSTPPFNYMAATMGSNGNTEGLQSGHGAAVFTVSRTRIDEKADFCPAGSTDASGQCPSEAASTFKDRFSIVGSGGGVSAQSSPTPSSPGSDPRAVAVQAGPGVGAPPGYGLTDPSALQLHAPIYIGNDSGFTAANGVRYGSGTPGDPYVISNWSFDGDLYPSAPAQIWIENTTRCVVIENNQLVNLNGLEQWAGIQLGRWPAIVNTTNATIRHNMVESQHAYGIYVNEGSRNVRVEANAVFLNATRDWTYGAVAMRGTHNVTFYGNYVDAYTNGTYHTVGIHLSDYFVSEARDATGLLAERNTVANATAGGIISESSHGTVVRANLVFMDYPGPKSVAYNYPRGIETEWLSNETTVTGNVIHTFHWGIQVGSDRDRIYSNTIYDVDYAIYVLDNGSWNGTSSYADTIYDTTYWNVSLQPFHFPPSPQLNVVDVGDGVGMTNFTPVVLMALEPPTQVDYAWAGQLLNVSATVAGTVIYDSSPTVESQDLRVTWSGSVAALTPSRLVATNVSFHLESAADTLVDGSGLLPDEVYFVNRSAGGFTTPVLTVNSTSDGRLHLALPAAPPSNYSITAAGLVDTVAPVTTESLAGTAGNAGWYTSSVTVALKATDAGGDPTTIHIRVDGGPWQLYTAPISLSGDGLHRLEYYASDAAGNAEIAHSLSVSIDATAPVTTSAIHGTLAANGSYVGSANVTLEASDATSGVLSVRVRVDSGSWRDYTGTIAVLGNGTHAVDYFAVDNAGNAEGTHTLSITVFAAPSSSPNPPSNLPPAPPASPDPLPLYLVVVGIAAAAVLLAVVLMRRRVLGRR